MKKLAIATSIQVFCVASICMLVLLLGSVVTATTVRASESTQGQTVFIPIAVGDITTFIPIMPSSSTASVMGGDTDGSYHLSWAAVSNASYYQVIITDETGEQRIIKVLGTSYDLAGLSLGSSKVEVQACNASNQCGVGSYAGTIARSSKVTYQHTDMLGTPVMESDESGNVISRSVYEPFGKRLGGEKAGIGYTGHLQDTDLGLTYMQARYYDPVIGRFYSNDPVGYTSANPVMSFNRYMYVNNNPYKYNDPDGKLLNFAIGAAVGFVSEVIVQTVIEGRSIGNLDTGRLGQSTAIGALSGGVGGAAGKLAGKVIGAVTKPASGMANGASRVATGAAQGTVSGATGSATHSAATQFANTGSVDMGQVGDAAVLGAATGMAGGAVAGQVRANAAQKTLGNPKAQTMFTNTQPGARAGAIAGNAAGAASGVGKATNAACQKEGSGC
ncbi:Conserved hypothetical protein [Shewanella piezotolerans WP3]|uniref:Teneurin-like YD-shell domain-containing protein n=1 Tax=Shewanella piezotolerans (strain WP3 / JCM 13877) TaxID=225849 RepID=B8CT59_SHEPW|nr:RHS repeat-associated core domain-containing protein [Shewanella piezotolerans]ACJ30835.1 Conserved hypothetical protein [Shewanella piezotolerans WP3]